MSAAAPLFRPLELGPLTLRNRLVMAPMTRGLSPGGVPEDASAAYYARRARGGVGMIVSEGIVVDHPSANGFDDIPGCTGAAVPAWRVVTQAVHAEGTAMLAQLWHVGAWREPGKGPVPGHPGFAPSDVAVPDGTPPRPMTENDIADVIAAYGRSAAGAVQAGFDGVEVHGAHGYLIDQFLWAETNRRGDAWGGATVTARARFAAEVVRAVRAEIGPQRVLGFRVSQWKRQDFEAQLAPTPDDLDALLGALADAGVDVFHASTRRWWEPAFAGSDLTLAGWARNLGGRPTIAVGSVGLDSISRLGAQPADINALIDRMAADEFDLVAVGRQLLSDPDWPLKVRDGRLRDAVAFEASHIDWRDGRR